MNASWDWADNFRMHEAACLIAGVPAMPKVTITHEELPADARQPLKQLWFAHVMWTKHHQSPESNYPKERMLKALPADGSEHWLSVMFSRGELHRWVQAMGRKSAYSFAPVGNSLDVERTTQPAQAQSPATPAPVEALVPASDFRPDPERRLALLRELGGAAKYARCEWTFTGIKALVTSEKAAGRKRSTEKTVRADLKEAAQNERDAKNAGFATGLGQR